MDITMLFSWIILGKMAYSDAQTLHVNELDLWIYCGLCCFHLNYYSSFLIVFLILSCGLIFSVVQGYLGSADRDCIMIMMLVFPYQELLRILLFASLLGLFYAYTRQKKMIPYLFFIVLGHFLNFCLKVL